MAVRVVFRPNPLRSGGQEDVFSHFPAGQSLAEIIRNDTDRLHVELEGVPVPRSEWALTYPAEGAEVMVHPVPGYAALGALIYFIAYYVGYAAAYAAAYLGASVGVATAIGTVVGAAIAYGVAAGIVVGLSMAVNALVKPQTPSDRGTAQGSRYSSLSGATNLLSRYEPIPKLYGTWRMIPPKGGETYTEIAGNDQYLHLLLCLGYGPMSIGGHIVGRGRPKIGYLRDDGDVVLETTIPNDTIRIGETSLHLINGVQWEICGPEALSLYTNDVAEQSLSIEYKHTHPGGEGGWFADGQAVIRTTDDNAMQISLDIAYPAMMSIGKNGEEHDVTVEWKIEYAVAGSGVWTVVRNPLSHTGRSRSPKRFNVAFTAKQGGVPTAGRYDVRLTRIRTYVVDENILQSDAYWTALRSVRKIAPWNYDTATGGIPDVVMLAMRVKATGQVNGQLDAVSVLGTSVLRVWYGAEWLYLATENPAWCYVDALQGPQLSEPLADSRLDLPGLQSWGLDNDANGRKYNWYHTADETLLNRIRPIARCGRAEWAMLDGRFSVVRDNQFTPVALITPRNAWGFRYQRVFPNLPHALRVKYVDPVAWTEVERIVLADGYQLDGKDAFGNAAPTLPVATQFEVLETQGVTDARQAFKEGRYFLAAAEHRQETYWVEQDFEALALTRGDCANLAYDVLLVGLGSGRIREVETSGGHAVAVTTDETWGIEAGTTYGVRIRLDDGSQATAQISNAPGDTRRLALATPLSGIEVGNLLVFGESTRETILVKITNIDYRPDFSCELTMTPAAPEIQGAETGEIPEFDPVVTIPAYLRKPGTPVILAVTVGGEAGRIADNGAYVGSLVVQWALPSTPVAVGGFEVLYYGEGMDPVTMRGIPETQFVATLSDCPIGLEISVQVRAVSIYGRWGQYSEAAFGTVGEIATTTEPPTNLSLSTVVTVRTDGTVDYNILADWDAPAAGRIDHYEVEWRRTTGGDSWAGEAVSRSTTEYLIPTLWEGATYEVRVRTAHPVGVSEWISGSVTVAVKNTPPGAPFGLSAMGEQTGVTLRWTNPSDNDLAVIEVWESASNDRAAAFLLSRLAGNSLFRSLPDVDPRYYWVRAEDTSGNQSAWHPLGQYAGVEGNAGGLDGLLLKAGSVITAALADSAVTIAKLADEAVSATKFAAGIQPVAIVDSLPYPGGYTGPNTVFLTTDGKLYRYSGGAWTAAVPAADVTGQLTSAQIADLAATKITGQLSNAQIADLAAAKITGQISSTQITDGAISTPKLEAGAVTTAKIAANAVTASEIAAESITTAKIAAGAITTAKIAADAVTANEIAAGTITATELAAGAITTAKIAAGAVTADELAANAVTAGKVAAGAISTTQLAAGAVTTSILGAGAVSADKIAAGSIDSTKLVSGTVITGSAQILDGIIVNAKIGNAEISTLKVAGQAISVQRAASGGPNTFGAVGSDFYAGICTIIIDSVTSGARGPLNIIMLGSAYAGNAVGEAFSWGYNVDGGSIIDIGWSSSYAPFGTSTAVVAQIQISLSEASHYLNFYIRSNNYHSSSYAMGGISILESKR